MTILVLIVREKNVTNAKSDNTFHLYFRYRDSGGRVREYIYIKGMVKSKGFSEIENGFKICNKYNIVKD